MVSPAVQLGAMLHKNVKLKQRNVCGSLCETGCPIVTTIIAMLYIYMFLHLLDFSQPANLDFPTSSLNSYYLVPWNCEYSADLGGAGYEDSGEPDANSCVIAVYPDTNTSRSIFATTKSLLKANWDVKIQSNVAVNFFSDENEFQTACQSARDASKFMFGIKFDIPKTSDLTNGINYTLRVRDNLLPSDTKPSSAMSANMEALYNASIFMERGVAMLSTAVDQAVIKETLAQKTSSSLVSFSLSILTKLLPAPAAGSPLNFVIPVLASSFQILCTIPFLAFSIIHLVSEKTAKTREYLMILGLKKWVYWLSWFVTFAIEALLLTLVMFCAYFSIGSFHGSNLAVVLLTYLGFFASLIAFIFFVQTFVSSTVVAFVVTFAWLYLPTQIFGLLPADHSVYMWLSFCSPMAFQLATYKSSAIAFANGASATSAASVVSYAEILMMMGVDTLIYSVLAWYFIEVSPAGDYGVSRPLWFPFQLSYWFPNRQKRSVSPSTTLSPLPPTSDDSHFEKYDQGERGIGVRIDNLTKVFRKMGSSVTAVDSLSCSFERGQITSLLGQNGAGKTTTISMLVGLLEPTAGDALVDGRSIVSDMTAIRESIGICPQFDLLYPTLTAMEHLELIGRLRGVPSKQASLMAQKALDDISLTAADHKGKVVKEFSGGMKRKLSLAMALFGDPSVVLLDEPSSGVDTVSRRAIWESLKKAAVGKTMVLTTHSMEEADALSDRILIMAHGRLKCSGTTLFLKQKFGSGYNLHVESPHTTDLLYTEELFARVTSFIPAAVLGKTSHHSATVKLPFTASTVFPAMLHELEANKASLGVGSVAVSLTTLEDVFVRINTEETIKTDTTPSSSPSPATSTTPLVPKATEDVALLESGATNFVDSKLVVQFLILLRAKLMFFVRSWKTTVVMTLIPTIILLFFILPTKFSTSTMPSTSTDLKSLTLVANNNYQTPLKLAYVIDQTVQNHSRVTEFLQEMNKAASNTLNPIEFPSVSTLQTETAKTSGYTIGLIFRQIDLQSTTATKSLDVVLMYNSSYSWSGIGLQNLVDLTAYRMVTGNPSLSLNLYAQALVSETTQLIASTTNQTSSFYVILSLLIGFLISAAFAAQRSVSERENMVKSQMYLFGIHPVSYILSSYAASLLSMIVPVSLALVVVLCFSVDGMSGAMFFPFVMICLVFIAAITSFNLLVSNLFNKADSCIKWVFLFELVIAIIPYAITLLAFVASKNGATLKLLLKASSLIPMCGLLNGLVNLTVPVPSSVSEAFSVDNIGLPLIIMSVDVILYFCLAVSWEFFKLYSSSRPPLMATAMTPEDPDVTAERQRVESGSADGDQVVCKSLHKQYKSGGKVAVHNLSLAIRHEEAFGLLGPNGAGKSSTIQMISGEIPITNGSVKVNNCSLEGLKHKYFHDAKISRCMQTDAIFEYLTGRENLEFFCRARIHTTTATMNQFVDRLITDCGLTEFANRTAETYSGGNRRKLSVAISLLPGASTVILDEPSTGMDPMTRRSLWGAIHRQRTEGRAVLLTTHSMEEAESVCSTIGIIAAGQLQCIGDVQHLKQKFSDGYTLSLEIPPSAGWDACDQLVGSLVKQPPVVVLEWVDNRRTYKLGDIDSLAQLFACLEDAKAHNVFSQYTLNQASLEDVFLRITRLADIQQHII